MRKTLLIIILCILLVSIINAGPKEDLLFLINQERASLGRDPLTNHPNIEIAAQLHSEDMLAQNYFSHTSLDGRLPWDRMNNAGFFGTAYAENIAYHWLNPNATLVFNMWKGSSGHYANMINSNYNVAGIGIASDNWPYNGGHYSSIFTLNLGRINIECQDNETRQCGQTDVGECEYGTQTCSNNQWSSCIGNINPIQEICDDNLDNDCDGEIDECIVCEDHDYFQCYNNDVYWYDSCNQRQDRKEDCVDGCSQGQCITCEDNSYTSCYYNDVYWYDSCGRRQTKKQDCEEGCEDGECATSCLDIELCNGVDDDCDDEVDEDCVENIEILSPEQNSEFDTSRVEIELEIADPNSKVEYNRKGRWMRFCSDPEECKKTLSLNQGENTIEFRAIDSKAQESQAILEVFVDSRKPRLNRQLPRNRKHTNGEFTAVYSEDYLEQINLYINNENILVKESCDSGKMQECILEYDVSDYEGQEIEYYFEVKDKFFTVSKNPYKVIVDTIAPELEIVSFEKISDRYERYKAEIVVSEEVKLTYDYEGLRRPRSICSRCDEKTKTFSFRDKPDYIDIIAVDKAGNQDVERIIFL